MATEYPKRVYPLNGKPYNINSVEEEPEEGTAYASAGDWKHGIVTAPTEEKPKGSSKAKSRSKPKSDPPVKEFDREAAITKLKAEGFDVPDDATDFDLKEALDELNGNSGNPD